MSRKGLQIVPAGDRWRMQGDLLQCGQQVIEVTSFLRLLPCLVGGLSGGRSVENDIVVSCRDDIDTRRVPSCRAKT